MAADFMNQRLSEAEHLMGSIIVDKPELPPWGELATGEGTAFDSELDFWLLHDVRSFCQMFKPVLLTYIYFQSLQRIFLQCIAIYGESIIREIY